jgi:hypothetical protein
MRSIVRASLSPLKHTYRPHLLRDSYRGSVCSYHSRGRRLGRVAGSDMFILEGFNDGILHLVGGCHYHGAISNRIRVNAISLLYLPLY